MAPDSFHPFQDLPVEMRNKIWKLSIPASRLHLLTAKGDHDDKQSYYFKTYSPTPLLLLVNRELSAVASVHYKCAFAYNGAKYPDAGFATTWFGFERDILLIGQAMIHNTDYNDGYFNPQYPHDTCLWKAID
jgi:hypothetical protein